MKTSILVGGLLLLGATVGCGDDTGGGGGGGSDATSTSSTTASGTTSSTSGGSTSGSTSSSSGGGDTSSASTSSGEGGSGGEGGEGPGATSSVGTGGNGGGGTSSVGTGGSSSVNLIACDGAEIAVTIGTVGLAFDPALVTIAVGDVVRFTPGGFHDMTSDDGTWASGQPGDTACLEFTAPGLFPFHCSVHPASMTGTVTVE